ncbi:MAG: FtsQ-type POTRA domain-containing protein [Treponema sp.]|nr:FtsQ-type POTRA domain-containing protein [Treponema sp.]
MSDVGLLQDEDFLDKDYFLTAEVETEDSRSADNKIKIIKVIFIVLCILLIGELVAYKYIMPSFSNPKVTVSGQKNYSAEEIARKLLKMNANTWFDFDVDQAVSILSSEAGIESVSVEKHFPDKIFINVVERDPVAVTFVVENGRTYPVEIDKNGVLFHGKENYVADTAKVPIISGLPIEYMAQGMRIPNIYRPLIEQIASISALPQKYFAGISEICVLPNEFGNYELALFPAQSKIKVLTDRALNEDALKYMMVVLDVVNQIGTVVSEVDLRYGSVSVKTVDVGEN